MRIREKLKKVFPTSVNKDGETFKALICNDNGTGVIEKELETIIAYMNEWASSCDIYEQTGKMLSKSFSALSYLSRYYQENDASIVRRLNSIFYRKGDDVWGTPWNIKHVFENYYGLDSVYVMENTDESDNNLIQNPVFEFNTDYWTFNGATLTKEAAFVKSYGMDINENNTVHQTVEIEESGIYTLHFFMNGKVKLEIIDNNNRKWDSSNEKWSATAVNTLTSEEWINKSLWFKVDESVSSITIKFTGTETGCFVDYVQLYKKMLYPTFTVYVHFDGNQVGNNTLALAPGESDPGSRQYTDYFYTTAAKYYARVDDRDVKNRNGFIYGESNGMNAQMMEEILEYVKPQGTKGFIELLHKNT